MLYKQEKPNLGGGLDSRRTLQPCIHLEKYTTGWECSVCKRSFQLTRAERQDMATYGPQVPSRIRHLFEVHSCSESGTAGKVRSWSIDDKLGET